MNKLLRYNKENKQLAKGLRKSLTSEERNLWYQYLRLYPIKFYRQRCIGNYIVDFYCSKAKLVIELDGSQHYEEKAVEYDSKRTRFLEEQGLSVLRFTNRDVKYHFEEVCYLIDEEVKKKADNMCEI